MPATVYLGGLLIAAFVSIPIVNLATPLFAMSLMVHVHKRLGGKQVACRATLPNRVNRNQAAAAANHGGRKRRSLSS